MGNLESTTIRMGSFVHVFIGNCRSPIDRTLEFGKVKKNCEYISLQPSAFGNRAFVCELGGFSTEI